MRAILDLTTGHEVKGTFRVSSVAREFDDPKNRGGYIVRLFRCPSEVAPLADRETLTLVLTDQELQLLERLRPLPALKHDHGDNYPDVPCRACEAEADARRPYAAAHAQPETFIAVGRCIPFDTCSHCLASRQAGRGK